jgi:hypothetical protein
MRQCDNAIQYNTHNATQSNESIGNGTYQNANTHQITNNQQQLHHIKIHQHTPSQQVPWTHEINAHIRDRIATADLVLFSYVVYESAACEHDFLPKLLLV